MYKHILISTDGSKVGQNGVDHGLSLAKSLGAHVTLITVTERHPLVAGGAGAAWAAGVPDIATFQEAQTQYAKQVLDSAKLAAARLGVDASVLHVPDAYPAEAIVDAAKSEGCSLIVIASHGRRGLGRLLLGSQTAEVLAHSPVPVLVVR
ncbi:MAG: universal stress protein [Pseudomonadota bacterium]